MYTFDTFAIMGCVEPLSADNPIWHAEADELPSAARCERAVITVAVHGNEPCGVQAANELLAEGSIDFVIGTAPWPPHLLSFTLMLGNPKAFAAKKRCLDSNLNRAFTSGVIAAASSTKRPGSHRSTSTDDTFTDTPTAVFVQHCGGCAHFGYEERRAVEVASVISSATVFVDIHSTSARAKAFAFHASSEAAQAWASTFPVEFVVEDTSLIGTTFEWASRQGIERATLVECGQHDASTSVDIAKQTILRVITGRASDSNPIRLRNAGSVMVKPGFKFTQNTLAFKYATHLQLLAKDDETGNICCPFPDGAYVVMPTEQPVLGEEAWMWGVPN